jgi:trans-aconitate methyltransferase
MLIFYFFILLIMGISLVLLIMSNVVFFKTKVPFISLSNQRIDEILNQIELKKGKLLYDLGCGDGRFLVKAYKKYRIRGIGYEINFWAYLRAKVKTYKYRKDIKIYYKNFFKENLENADYVFIYLMPEVMEMVGQKLKKELQASTLIISCAFHIPNIKVDQVLDTSLNKKNRGKVFLYNLV